MSTTPSKPLPPLPSWLKITADAAVVSLRVPSTINGVKVDTLTLRAPTVAEMRAATKQAGGDLEELELALFATLIGAGHSDLLTLDMRDYDRLQAGYFRLRADDGV